MIRNSAHILGVLITSTSASSVLEEILNFEAKTKLVVFTPNPEFLVAAAQNPSFREILNSSDINLPDGFGLVLAGKILGQPISGRISGADLTEQLLKVGNKKGPASTSPSGARRGGETGGGKWTIGIVGVRRGVIEESMELIKRLQEKYPNIEFINLDNKSEIRSAGWRTKSEKNSNDQDSKFNIQYSLFNVVLACQGMGKQEKWILENKNKVDTKVFMGIGGSLDFLTGFSKRAPRWMQSFGLEWLWRGLQKPEHFRRIWKAVFVFGWLVIKEKFQTLNTKS